jgi:hypothetical protein
MTLHHKLQDFKDYLLEELSIINFEGNKWELTGLRGPLYIYEDIFGGPISGSVEIYDALDLPHLLPIIGEERIKIKLSKPKPVKREDDEDVSDAFEREFRVYHISDRRLIRDNYQVYTIHFISEEFFRNFFQVVQRGFVKKRYSEMVEDVYDELIKINKPIEIEKTAHEHYFNAGNMNPFQFFNCLAAKSISEGGNGPTYLFYEDQDKFNFVTLGKLIEQEPVKTFIFQASNQPNIDIMSQGYRPYDTEKELENVEIYYHTSNINPIENIRHGMYGSTLWHIDPIRARYEKQEFKLSQEFKKFKHLDKSEPFRKEFDLLDKTQSHIKFMITDKDQDLQEHLIARDPNILPDKLEDCALQRTSQLFQINTVKLAIKVPGDPELKVGQTIEFELPQMAGDVAEDRPNELDNYLQGKYLITSMKHSIIQDKYTMTIEIIKDTYFSPIKEEDPAERYRDRY